MGEDKKTDSNFELCAKIGRPPDWLENMLKLVLEIFGITEVIEWLTKPWFPSSTDQQLIWGITVLVTLTGLFVAHQLNKTGANRSNKNRLSSRKKRASRYVLFSILLLASVFSIANPVFQKRSVARQQSEYVQTIRSNLFDSLICTQRHSFIEALDLIQEARNIAQNVTSERSNVDAYIAVSAQELAFQKEEFDLKSQEFTNAKQCASQSTNRAVLKAWLDMLAAEFQSKNGNISGARVTLDGLTNLISQLPGPVLCSLNIQLAICTRRLDQLDESRSFYSNAFRLAETNSAFPLWKLDFVAGRPGATTVPGLHARSMIVLPYAVALWESGERVNAVNSLQEDLRFLTNEPSLRFPILLNLAVFQWRLGDFTAATNSFVQCQAAMSRIPGFPNNVPLNYRMGLYANWAGALLEQQPIQSQQTIVTARYLLSSATNNISGSTQDNLEIDGKFRFEYEKNRVLLKKAEGDFVGAWTNFCELEGKWVPFGGCDPSSVAGFYSAFASAGKQMGVDRNKLFQLSVKAADWWLRAKETNRAESVGLQLK